MSTQFISGQSRAAVLTESRQRLRNIANQLPQRPGVYIMRDVYDTVIYVGKAVNLRRRVGSYATPSAMKDRKVAKLVGSTSHLTHVRTFSEIEALLIESRLIKANLPVFNRQLIDPESCCFLRVDMGEAIPRIDVVPFRPEDGADYLGPFWHSSFVRNAAAAVTNVFRLRRCSGTPAPKKSPCMFCQLGKCSGPCSGRMTPQGYRQSVQSAWDSLAGRSDAGSRLLTERRERLADQLRFEDAHTIHRQIRALGQIAASVPYASTLEGNFVVVAPSCLRGRPVVLIFRHGRLVSSTLSGPRTYPDPGIIAERLIRLCMPTRDLLPGKPSRDDQLIIHSYLNRRGTKGVVIPLISHRSVRSLADAVHAAVDALRAG